MKIIVSNTSRGAYNGVIEQLKSNMAGANIIIAPDRFMASIERSVIKSLEIDGTFNIDVMSFTRLANKLIGKDILKCLTPEGSVMLIGKVIGDLKDELEYYGKSALQEGFASELYAALTAIRNSGISSSALLKRQDEMKPSMRAKARDIARIYEGYLKALEGKHSDSSTRLCSLATFINDNPASVATTNFYCVYLNDFSQPELDILQGIAKNAQSLTIGMASGKNNPNRRIFPDRVISRLKGIAGGKVDIIECDEVLSTQMSAINRNLFSYTKSDEQKVDANGIVSLRVAKDIHDEIMALALDVNSAIIQKGGRYKDFEVYISDIEAYQDEIERVFDRYNIPYFLDKKALLKEQAKARYILDAIAVIRSQFKRREVLNFVKNPLFIKKLQSIVKDKTGKNNENNQDVLQGQDMVFLFENYCLKYNIEYSRFRKSFEFCDKYEGNRKPQKPKFIYSKCDDKVLNIADYEENDIPNIVRKVLIDLLNPIDKDKYCNIHEFVLGIRKMIADVDDVYQEYVDELSSINVYFSRCAEQVDNKLSSVLDEIDNVLDYDLDILQFESIVKSMVKTLKIALVPTFSDCVFIGDKDSQFEGCNTIYILGATTQRLPSVSSGGVVISQRDVDALSMLGVEITPSEKQKNMSAMFNICDLMTKPKKLVVSYPESVNGTSQRPSIIIYELQSTFQNGDNALEIERIDIEHIKNDLDKAKLLFASQDACYYEVIRNVLSKRADLQELDCYSSANEYIDNDNKERIKSSYRQPERIEIGDRAYIGGTTSVSRLESFYQCPYKHYFRYILSLNKRKSQEMEGTENGTIIHYVLERFYKDYVSNAINEQNIEEKANRYFDEAIRENKFERLFDRDDLKIKRVRLQKECVSICKELFAIQHHSEFIPTWCEEKIGGDNIKPMYLDVGGSKIQLKGTIDRIDKLDDNFLIIDYKTYKSADLELVDLYYGKKVQLYVYMRAVQDSLNFTPCGVFYLPIFSGLQDEDKSRYKFKGMTTDNVDLLCKIDDRISTSPNDAIAPYELSRGKLKASVHMKSSDMQKLGDYALAIASKGAKEIANGYIKPVPVAKSCERCDYQEICQYKNMFERKLPAVSSLQSFELSEVEDEK